jgi:5'-methylthioadenosine phosphorylase
VRRDVATPWGQVALYESDDHVVLQRHGLDRYVAPHAIDHRANLAALRALGADSVLAFGSVGALSAETEIGAWVAPDELIALQLGISTSDAAAGHRVVGFDPEWRATVIDAFERAVDGGVRDGGTYWQAIGPRFETAAEIALIRGHADVIGMTLASECIVAGELGLRYAAVCVVDNLANGVGAEPLTVAEFEAGGAASRARVRAALDSVAAELVGAS